MRRAFFFILMVLLSFESLFASSFSAEIPVSLYLSSSEYSLLLAQNPISPSDPQTSLFLPERVTHIEWVNKHQIRLHFATPIHIQMLDSQNHHVVSEKIFRQILIKADEETIEKLRVVTLHSNLTFNSSAIEQMTDIIERVEADDLDPLIKEFGDGKWPPSVNQRLGFVFSLDVDEIGKPEGMESQRTHVLSKIENHLSWTDHARETNVQSTPLGLITSVFTKDSPLMRDYFSALQRIEGRKQQLEYRGWIKPLLPHHGQLSILPPVAKKQLNASNTVVVLFTKIRCENLFLKNRRY